MNDFEGARTRSRSNGFNLGKNDFDNVRIRPKTSVYQNTGDDWLPFIGKKTASTLAELPDLPANLANLGESGIKWIAGKAAKNLPLEQTEQLEEFSNKPNYFREENVDRPSKWIKKGLDHMGIDITPKPKDGLQEIVGHGIEWAAPGGLWGKLSKAGSTSKAIKMAAGQGALGTASGSAQELLGVDPLTADLATIGTQAILPNPISLLSRFSKQGKIATQEKVVSKLLKDITKEQDLERLKNFNPESLDVIPVTAEVALNKNISNLHNAYAPNLTGIQNKQVANDEVLRKKLNALGAELNPNSREVGEAGREVIKKKLDNLEKIREKASAPLYAKLEESSNTYPVSNFNNYTDQAIIRELGDIEKGLLKHKNILPEKYKKLAAKSKTELLQLEKEFNKEAVKLDKKYSNLSPQAKEQILDQLVPEFSKKAEKINTLKTEIAKLESGQYKPGHIDKAITEIGNNITELKRSQKGGNESLIRHFKNQKKTLKADLEATPEGSAHREVYYQHSPGINNINRDKLLKKFVSKNEWNNYRVPDEDLPLNLMKSPRKNISNYMAHVKGTDAEKLTKAYIRDMYLGKAIDHNLPTYDKSSQFLRQRKDKLAAIYSPEELDTFNNINNYLKNRAEVTAGNSALGSATAAKKQLKENVAKYLGQEVTKPLHLAKHIPWLPFKHDIANFTKLNPKYEILELALTDPVYAKKLLTRQPLVHSKIDKYAPSLLPILNQ